MRTREVLAEVFAAVGIRDMFDGMERFDAEGLKTKYKGKWLRMHPLSGVAILLLDKLFFGVALFSGGIALPVTAALAFWTTFFAVWFIQRRMVGETRRMCFLKALASGVIAGIPTSIGGTFLASWVLLSSGLHPLRRRLKLR